LSSLLPVVTKICTRVEDTPITSKISSRSYHRRDTAKLTIAVFWEWYCYSGVRVCSLWFHHRWCRGCKQSRWC